LGRLLAVAPLTGVLVELKERSEAIARAPHAYAGMDISALIEEQARMIAVQHALLEESERLRVIQAKIIQTWLR
jgi:hypothetical protein